MDDAATFTVVAELCLRCGACSTLAPGLITMGDRAAVISRQPTSPSERARLQAALFNCPMLAIRKRSATS